MEGSLRGWRAFCGLEALGRSGRPPVLVGGMPVGGYAYVDGEMKAGASAKRVPRQPAAL